MDCGLKYLSNIGYEVSSSEKNFFWPKLSGKASLEFKFLWSSEALKKEPDKTLKVMKYGSQIGTVCVPS